jgi:isoquinoline 1-oxidoreductase beta subunit
LIDSVDYASPITTGAWRAPVTNFLAYAEQSFLDEIAVEIGKDPIAMRLELLGKAKTAPVGAIKYDIGRMEKVIKAVAEKAGWGKKKDVAQGFSIYFSHASYVAQICEVVKQDGKPQVKKFYAVSDCGIVVNKSGAKQQVMGGILDGMGHAMYGKLTFKNGEPIEKNFNSYRMIRMKSIPDVDASFIDNGIDPTGLGEPALPPTGGALANAVYKATGVRMYKQPFMNEAPFKS